MIEFAYKGIPYRIVFKEVKVYIQAYAAYCLLAVKKQLSVVPKVLLIDIGGFTVDYMVLRFGQLEMEYVDSLENGIIRLYNTIKAAIRQKYSILLDEEDIDNIILERGGVYKTELKERVREIDAHTDGFIYMVSSAATTGAQQDFNEQKRLYFKKIEDMHLKNPLMVGFGISNKATFQAACEHASGAIIGSRFVTPLEEEKDPEKAILKLKEALK